jgi:hypothetical protein
VGVKAIFADFLAGNRGFGAYFYCAPMGGNDLQNSCQLSAVSFQVCDARKCSSL